MPGGNEPRSYYVGVDVGTGSVRAALVDQRGTLLAFADQPINQWEPQFNHHEQSSEDIWAACCVVSKKVVQGVNLHQIRGLGFDATCSLVVLDKQFHPLPVNHEGDSHRNIIMWLDHRAVSQVHRINETKHSVLQYVGGVMSVEMQAPKLLWLKENLRETCWDKAGHFFDLPDFLSWKATGVTARFGNTQGSGVTSLLYLTPLENGRMGFEPTSKLCLTPTAFSFYSAYGHTSLGTHVGTSCDR